MSTYRDSDPATDIILDFIAGGVPSNPSGESEGNYNAVIGDIHAGADLAQMTIDDIYDLQARLLIKGRPSTAVGRYQIIRKTLRAMQAKMGLASDAHFTHELQDLLAVKLMVGRGYQVWWRGRMSDNAFAHALSMEWASLPDPLHGGRSYYDGDSAGNHASTTVAAVIAMLRRARAAKR